MPKKVLTEFKPGTLVLQGTQSYHFTSQEGAARDVILIFLQLFTELIKTTIILYRKQ